MSEIALDAGTTKTAGEIIEQMRRVAGPGERRLDTVTLGRLRRLTRDLMAVRPDAAAEHQRFLGVRLRGLDLPAAPLASRLRNATVLVTGGTGCIGSLLLAQLRTCGARRLISVSRGRTSGWPRLDGAEYRIADIRDAGALDAIVASARPDVIFHVAAQRDPGLAEIEVHRTITTNVLGTRNVLHAARAHGTGQVVYASTGKALRPYSAETYTASKRVAEWLMAETARSTDILCSATRFTHVVDNSIVYQRLLAWATGASSDRPPGNRAPGNGTPGNGTSSDGTFSDQAIRLHGPDISFYVQSALESAQLLMSACAGATQGELRIQAITDLGMPLTLLDLALGVLAATDSSTPVYFCGYDAGYEQVPFPGLYDPLTAGDVSPLLNAFEAASTTCCPSPMADSFRLGFVPDQRLAKQLRALAEDCERTHSAEHLRERLSELSWSLLDSALRWAPRRALERCAIQARRHWDGMIPSHRRMLEAIDDLIGN